jgi:ATP-dependent protease HslVU (ClpYQ) peptidase subunit
MTCIVGIEVQGKVLLAGDIQGTGGNNKIVHTQSKVFNKNGVVFGYTTSYRFGQILEHSLKDPVVPERDDEIYRWLLTVLVPEIKSTLKDNGWERGGNALIGIRGQLWELQDDFSVLRSVKGFGAVGSGYEYAMGSLFTSMTHNKPKTPIDYEVAIQRAIEVAGTFSPSVGTECTLVST